MERRQTGTHRRVLSILGIGLVFSLLGDATLYTVLPDPAIAAQVGVSLTMVGVLLGANRIVRVVFNLLAGWLYDRYPRRRILVSSLLIGGVSTLFYAAGYGIWILLIGRVLWGLAWSGLWVGANSVVLDLSTSKDRGRLSGALQAWFFVGAAFSSFAGGWFTDLLGFRPGLWLSGGLSLAAWVLWVFILPETRPDCLEREESKRVERLSGRMPWRVVGMAAAVLFITRFVFAGILNSTTILWLGQFLPEGLSIGSGLIPLATLTGTFVALRVAISMIGAPVAGRLSDYLGRRWGVMAGLLLLGCVGVWLMTAASMWWALAGALVAFAGVGGIQSLVPAVIGDGSEEWLQSRALSIVFILGDLGSAVGPPIALGLLPQIGLDAVYRYSAGLFVVVGFVILIASVLQRKYSTNSKVIRKKL